MRSTVRALPALMRIGFAEAVAYRAEMLVWVLSTTMPLVMLALWSAVAREAPVGRYGQREFVAYFLATFIVRQLTGAWVGWQLNYEVRTGALAMRLLKPLSPVVSYAIETLAALPLRVVVAIPVAVVMLVSTGSGVLPHDPAIWLLWLVSLLGAWLITFLAQFCMGALSFFFQSSLKVIEVWYGLFMLFSGYLFPLDLLPRWARLVADALPFRYLIALPVELVTSLHDPAAALQLIAMQWLWVGIAMLLSALVWKKGVARFAAYGG